MHKNVVCTIVDREIHATKNNPLTLSWTPSRSAAVLDPARTVHQDRRACSSPVMAKDGKRFDDFVASNDHCRTASSPICSARLLQERCYDFRGKQ